MECVICLALWPFYTAPGLGVMEEATLRDLLPLLHANGIRSACGREVCLVVSKGAGLTT